MVHASKFDKGRLCNQEGRCVEEKRDLAPLVVYLLAKPKYIPM